MARSKHAPRRVLLVGRDLDLLRRAAFPLISAGYDVQVLPFDENVSALVHAQQPDLVVLDNIGRWQTVVRLLTTFRTDFALYQMAVIVITEEKEASAQASGLRHHRYQILQGPVDAPQLTARMRHMLEGNSTLPKRARA
jgi:DNA-binding response OmpR family regulator